MKQFWKRYYPLLCLPLIAALAVFAVLTLGGRGLNHPDFDPSRVRAGELTSQLRNGQVFSLAQVYPQAWDTVQFSVDRDELSQKALRKLMAYDPSMALGNTPLLLLWREGELAEALPLPSEAASYPRFFDGSSHGDFSLSREEAWFLCTFVPGKDGGNGYYTCTPVESETV